MLDEQSLVLGLSALTEPSNFQPGERVKTLKGSLRGTVRKLLPDGRVVWQPDRSQSELVALPESLLRERKR